MKYRVVHKTEYAYGELVPLSHNVIRGRPRETHWQTCAYSELFIRPAPAARRDRVDFFGNEMTWVSLQEPHKSLRVEARSEVEVMPPLVPPADSGLSWERARDLLARDLAPELLDARQYTYDSPYVPRHDELADYARPSFTPGRPLLAAATDLMRRIHNEFTFDSRATTIDTPVLDVLHHRHGVCQDFAHLQIGCLRSLGLAARYVSGYIVTHPPPGQPRLVGCDASHAWVSVFLPTFGWIDFDPTNDVIPSDEHITVAWARDYDDVSPVRGIIVGSPRHWLNVSVDVQPLDPKTGEPVAAVAPAPAPAVPAPAAPSAN